MKELSRAELLTPIIIGISQYKEESAQLSKELYKRVRDGKDILLSEEENKILSHVSRIREDPEIQAAFMQILHHIPLNESFSAIENSQHAFYKSFNPLTNRTVSIIGNSVFFYWMCHYLSPNNNQLFIEKIHQQKPKISALHAFNIQNTSVIQAFLEIHLQSKHPTIMDMEKEGFLNIYQPSALRLLFKTAEFKNWTENESMQGHVAGHISRLKSCALSRTLDNYHNYAFYDDHSSQMWARQSFECLNLYAELFYDTLVELKKSNRLLQEDKKKPIDLFINAYALYFWNGNVDDVIEKFSHIGLESSHYEALSLFFENHGYPLFIGTDVSEKSYYLQSRLTEKHEDELHFSLPPVSKHPTSKPKALAMRESLWLLANHDMEFEGRIDAEQLLNIRALIHSHWKNKKKWALPKPSHWKTKSHSNFISQSTLEIPFLPLVNTIVHQNFDSFVQLSFETQTLMSESLALIASHSPYLMQDMEPAIQAWMQNPDVAQEHKTTVEIGLILGFYSEIAMGRGLSTSAKKEMYQDPMIAENAFLNAEQYSDFSPNLQLVRRLIRSVPQPSSAPIFYHLSSHFDLLPSQLQSRLDYVQLINLQKNVVSIKETPQKTIPLNRF